jgi:hypothetical protein
MNNLKKSQEAQAELAKRELARRHLKDFVLYNFEGYKVNWHHEVIFDKLEQVERGDIKRLMIFMPPRHGKLIADNTPVITVDGWKKHGELKKGDYVYSPCGNPIKVKKVFEKDEANLEVKFSNGEKIKCHENHEWTVFDRSNNKYRTLETKYILSQKYYSNNRSRFQLQNIMPLENSVKELPIEPYFFGAWLGDGTSVKPATTCEIKDKDIIDNCGYKVNVSHIHKDTGVPTYYFSWQGIIQKIRALGCYNNKHIPEIYKRSSIEQRLKLLAGLIDTDGSIDEKSRIRIVTVSKLLADDIAELIYSLGMRPYIMCQKPTISTSGIQGKRNVYSIGFQPTMEIPVALNRKRVKRIVKQNRIGIVDINEIKSEKGNCITVDSTDGLYLVGKSLIPTHNSEIGSIQFPAWLMGRNSNRNIIEASYSGDLATDFGRQTRNLIKTKKYQNVFKGVTLAEDSEAKGKWNTNGKGAYNAVGVGGATTGKGADFLIIDDPIKNRQDAESETIRENVWDWYRSTARTRLSPNGAIVLIITRWHDDDLAGRILNKNPNGWEIIKFPAIAEEDEEHRKQGEALWADFFTKEILEETRADIGNYEFSALYQQNPLDEESQEFHKHWFKDREWEEVTRLNTRRFLTIDTAISAKASADFTGFCDNSVDPDKHWNLKAWKMKLNPKDLIDMLFTLHRDRQYETIGIEKTIYLDTLKPFLDEEQIKRNTFLPITQLKHNQQAKELRIRALIPRYEAGGVFHIKNECKDLEHEMLRFPKGVHDDVLDATAYQIQIAAAPERPVKKNYWDDVWSDELEGVNNKSNKINKGK